LPVLVGNVGVKEVACGGDGNSGTICLVYFDKSINCSGSGTYGQLGNGQFQDSNVFVQVLGLPTFSPTGLPTSMNTECVPSVGINKKQCLQKVNACGISNSMKWTGKGCTIARVRQFDGGCQCKGYCGYTCKGACNKDFECVWIPAFQTCVNKVTGVGGPKPIC
jgi:hypothetical protein